MNRNKEQIKMSNVANKLAAIQDLAENVQFVSEQTHEVNAFVVGRNQTMTTASSFKSAMPSLQNETVVLESFDDVVSAQENRDSSGAWSTLRSYIEENLSNVVLLKTGTIQREVFAVGLLDGHIVGVRTFAIET